MKTAQYFLLLLALTEAAALADAPVPTLDHWVQENPKQVTFAGRPILTVNLTVLAVNANNYGQLDVSFSYDHNPQNQAEINALQSQFPGYALSRAMLDARGPLTLVIPAISMNQAMNASVSPNGPWFDYATILTQTQTQALQKALAANPNAVTVTGNVQASVPTPTVVEHFSLPVSTCDSLFSGGEDLYSVMVEYASVVQTIAGLPLKYPTTADALKRSVLDNCVNTGSPSAPVTSFAALLATPVIERTDKQNPYGETTQMIPTATPLPVKYDLSITGGST